MIRSFSLIHERRKLAIFFVGITLLILVAMGAMLRKKDSIVTIQTEKVARRNITEVVVANGKIQPVMQVHISAAAHC